MSNSLQPYGLQHARLPCPSLSPGIYSNWCALSWWCSVTISFSAALLLLLSVFPSIKVFSSESVLHIWWPRNWSFNVCSSNKYSGLISFSIVWFDPKGLSRVFSSTTSQKHQFFGAQPSLWFSSLTHSYLTTWKNHSFNHTDLYQ